MNIQNSIRNFQYPHAALRAGVFTNRHVKCSGLVPVIYHDVTTLQRSVHVQEYNTSKQIFEYKLSSVQVSLLSQSKIEENHLLSTFNMVNDNDAVIECVYEHRQRAEQLIVTQRV